MNKHRWETVDIKLLTKEELVIEYVSARFWLGIYADNISNLSIGDYTGFYFNSKRLNPGKEWGKKICRYMWKHRDINNLDMDGTYMVEYGVDTNYGAKIFKNRNSGRVSNSSSAN